MLKFAVYENGKPAVEMPLRFAHLLGADDVGMRGRIGFADGVISCEKTGFNSAALALQWPVENHGHLMLQTCLLPDREDPYLLSLELARHRLMKLIAKQEDWSLFDLPEDHPASKRLALARKRFIDALDAIDDPVQADALARQALALGVDASEEMTLAQALPQVQRRKQNGLMPRSIFGCGVGLELPPDRVGPVISTTVDYLSLPVTWRQIEPVENEFHWEKLDAWSDWAVRQRMPLVGGPIVSFTNDSLPDWLYVWEHDYQMLREALFSHIDKIVSRYRGVFGLWNVLGGIHVNQRFGFSFDQMMDLTRMAVLLVKKLQPNARTLVEITQPFGAYYADNPRAIPPTLYAEMIIQAGIPVDGFGLKLVMGRGEQDKQTRDLFQIGHLLDRYVALGKPMHITAVGVPSEPAPGGTGGSGAPGNGGYWRRPWTQTVQAHWMEAFYNIALSKPLIECISWVELVDRSEQELAFTGLVSEKGQAKNAMRRLATIRKAMTEAGEAKKMQNGE